MVTTPHDLDTSIKKSFVVAVAFGIRLDDGDSKLSPPPLTVVDVVIVDGVWGDEAVSGYTIVSPLSPQTTLVSAIM